MYYYYTQCHAKLINASYSNKCVIIFVVGGVVIIILALRVGDIAISGGVGFTVDSDLNGASPQFTLTCISTGGPATTVTWTRDSDTVTEGNETVLDDRVTAQYTHTLTVTGRLGGLYTCTVANDKPSEDSAQLNIQGVMILPFAQKHIY